MRGGQNHLHVKAQLFNQLPAQAAQHGAGHRNVLENGGGQAQAFDQLKVPGLGNGVQQLGGGSLGIFVGFHAAEHKMEVVGHG